MNARFPKPFHRDTRYRKVKDNCLFSVAVLVRGPTTSTMAEYRSFPVADGKLRGIAQAMRIQCA